MNDKWTLKISKATNKDKACRTFYRSYAWKKIRCRAIERDNNECQWCKARGMFSPAETVHHIKYLKDRPDLALDIDNLVTLCFECHSEHHAEDRQGSKKFQNVERW